MALLSFCFFCFFLFFFPETSLQENEVRVSFQKSNMYDEKKTIYDI